MTFANNAIGQSLVQLRFQKAPYPAYTIENGIKKPLNNYHITGRTEKTYIYPRISDKNDEIKFHEPEIVEFQKKINTIDTLITNNPIHNYRDIVKNKTWLEIYKPKINTMETFNWETGLIENRNYNDIFACRKCGTILRLEQIEIDHQRTRTAGIKHDIPEKNLWGATLKLFRYAGLTGGGATGFKAKSLNLNVAMLNAQNKYTLNLDGILIFSLILAHHNDHSIQNIAETAIPNLRPLCGSCNKKSGEPHTKLPWN
ncbi:hypothetical protein [Chromobacterium sp. IIBBL 290-4]|uniref:hypothetical protein n=1 Tax=Chromobacterium sp. IIBBL 290-4 TaxID=2953890 RepID=UPI0020B8B392|nr:hypothetical protein [Chromobacterium sp. IIBBL 290-4]UTH75151.1 hypothetical protein NKT35_03360 [Chromobacterium sp. IIBBL 290-4]